jgi:hypothetical protein
MVLDGQQRVHSLLLALVGDIWAFKLLDRQGWRSEQREFAFAHCAGESTS